MQCLDELLEYALSRATINECYPHYNMLKIRRILLQMIEGPTWYSFATGSSFPALPGKWHLRKKQPTKTTTPNNGKLKREAAVADALVRHTVLAQ